MRRRGIPNVSIYKPKSRSTARHKWLVAYLANPDDLHRTVESVSTDYEVTRQYACELSRKLDRRRLGLITADDDKLAAAAAIPLADHITDFADWLIARGVTEKQSGEVKSRLTKLAEWCEFHRLGELSASKVQSGVNDWRDENGRAAETCNKYLKAAKQFSKWASSKAERKITEHVFSDLTSYNVEADRRHVRRSLTGDELAALLAATERGEVWVRDGRRMSGPDRRILYTLAAYTGLRRSELASLTPESFDLGERTPTVTVDAAHSKHRRTDVLFVRADVAALLRPWLDTKAAGKRIFAVPDKAFLMLYADMAAAGVAISTTSGIADFHSLRHTFGTILAASGAPITVLRELMRHTDIRLTMRYVHPTLHDQVKALDGLPGLAQPRQQQQLRATGTYGGAAPDSAAPGAENETGPLKKRAGFNRKGVSNAALTECSRQVSNLQPSASEADATTPPPSDAQVPAAARLCNHENPIGASARSGPSGTPGDEQGRPENAERCATRLPGSDAPPPTSVYGTDAAITPAAPAAPLDLDEIRAAYEQLGRLLGKAPPPPVTEDED